MLVNLNKEKKLIITSFHFFLLRSWRGCDQIDKVINNWVFSFRVECQCALMKQVGQFLFVIASKLLVIANQKAHKSIMLRYRCS